MKVATCIRVGSKAMPELAAEAVSQAMQKADISIASSVLLLLTSEFSHNPQPAIMAAAKASNCMQIMGCTASGIFTEDDWVLDAPAAAAMVWAGDVSLQRSEHNPTHQPLLTLCAPNAINSTWLNDGNQRFGGVSGDASGQGHFSVWQNAKGELSGQIEAFFSGVNMVTRASHGLQLLTSPVKINQVQGFDIVWLENQNSQSQQTPYAILNKAWQAHNKIDTPLPLHLMMAIYAESESDLHLGKFKQTNLIAYDEQSGSITLAQPLQIGQWISWGLRDAQVAEADMFLTTHQLTQDLVQQPEFGLFFSNMGRGPYFYNGIDRDLKVITKQLPNMPLLGFYGNGEIATIGEQNQLLAYSAVLSLFSSQ